MNRILIASTQPAQLDRTVFFVELSSASDLLAILRSDHFASCQINVGKDINNSQLRFLMQVSRILSSEGRVIAAGDEGSITKIKTILKNLGLFQQTDKNNEVSFSKKQAKVEPADIKISKFTIGFKSLEEEQIDEEDLLKNEKIDLNKAANDCGEKLRACANCNCGRKNNEPLPSKEELVKSVNEGNPVSGCGKCYLGDSFRCATCPYQGLPAFKPGDKLKLVDESKVIVENSATVVSNGKVKIEL